MLNNSPYDSLTKREQSKLNKKLRSIQGGVTWAKNETGLSYETLRKLRFGMAGKKENVQLVREKLLNQKLETISETELTNEG